MAVQDEVDNLKLVEEALTNIWMAVDALVNLNDKTQASNHLLSALDDISEIRKITEGR